MRPASRLLALLVSPTLVALFTAACEPSRNRATGASDSAATLITASPGSADSRVARAPQAGSSTSSAIGSASSAPLASSSSSSASARVSASAVPALPATDYLCDGDRYALQLGASGVFTKVDCALAAKRCVAGACVARVCTPNALSCDNGNLFRCNAAGSALIAEKTCRPDAMCDSATTSNGPSAACVTTCPKHHMNVVIATYDCEACDWSHEAFCAQIGPENTCSESLCQMGALGFGVAASRCARVTEGLIVPGTRKLGACKAIMGREDGVRTINEDVCDRGNAVPRKRFESCVP